MTMTRLISATFTVLVTLAVVILLWQFRVALLLFLFSLIIAAALSPAIDYWIERGLKRGWAILLTYPIWLALVLGLFWLALPPLLNELSALSNTFTQTYEQIVTTWPMGTPFQQAVASRLPPSSVLFGALAGDQGSVLARLLLGVAQSFASIISQAVIVLILSIYWSIDRVRFERLWLSVLPVRLRERARIIWRSIEKGVGAYIRSEFIQSVLAGLLLGLGYALMGLPYPALLAVSGAILWLIPWLGAVLAVILPVLVAVGLSPLLAAAAGIYTLLILLSLEIIVEPRFFNRRRYSSLLVVIVVVFMANAYGLLGVIIAPPLAAALQIFFRNLLRLSSPSEIINPGVQITQLQTRLAGIKDQVEEGEQASPEVTSLMNRLSELLDQTHEYFQEEIEDGV